MRHLAYFSVLLASSPYYVASFVHLLRRPASTVLEHVRINVTRNVDVILDFENKKSASKMISFVMRGLAFRRALQRTDCLRLRAQRENSEAVGVCEWVIIV